MRYGLLDIVQSKFSGGWSVLVDYDKDSRIMETGVFNLQPNIMLCCFLACNNVSCSFEKHNW